MESFKVYKLPNFEGGLDYVDELGNKIDEDTVNKVNADRKSGIRYVSVGATDEQKRKHLGDLLLESAETDKDLELGQKKIESILNPNVKTVTQQASPKERRMAASFDFKKELSQAMKPWVSQKSSNNNQGLWVGKNVTNYGEAAKDLEYEIRSHGKDQKELMISKLRKDFGYGRKQAINEVNKLLNDSTAGISEVSLGVPNATADERLSLLALQGSDVQEAQLWNKGDPIYATDIMIGTGRDRKGIDAQRQFGEEFKIGILQNLGIRDARAAGLLFAREPDIQIKELISKIKDKNNSTDDKLLHSLYLNDQPSNRVADELESIRKDYLISTDMRGWKQPAGESKVFKYHHGPYNPTAGRDINVIDLNALRSEVLNRTPAQLQADMQGIVSPNNSKLELIIPRNQIIQHTADDLLDRSVVNEILKRRRWGRR